MTPDKLKGKWMAFTGDLKSQYGKFTDAALQQIEGIDNTIIGKVQERYGDKNDGCIKWEKPWRKQSASEATKPKTH